MADFYLIEAKLKTDAIKLIMENSDLEYNEVKKIVYGLKSDEPGALILLINKPELALWKK